MSIVNPTNAAMVAAVAASKKEGGSKDPAPPESCPRCGKSGPCGGDCNECGDSCSCGQKPKMPSESARLLTGLAIALAIFGLCAILGYLLF